MDIRLTGKVSDSFQQGAASDFDRMGPRVGDRFPDLVLPDQHGQPVDLHHARAGHKALVVFYRSAGW
jgi:Redoxin